VISAGKTDIMQYSVPIMGGLPSPMCAAAPAGLCDAIFRAEPVIGRGEGVLVGLPIRSGFPRARSAPAGRSARVPPLPVDRPESFDAVVLALPATWSRSR